MTLQQSRSSFALCVEDGGSDDLEPRKLYRVLPDREAAREGYVRVVDESGEDYIYSSELFVAIKLPAAALKRFEGFDRTRMPPTRRRSAGVRARRSRPTQ
jgi:hypothetical protein